MNRLKRSVGVGFLVVVNGMCCRLLLSVNVDINAQTHQGTALHEAALYGKIGAVKQLIDVSDALPGTASGSLLVLYL